MNETSDMSSCEWHPTDTIIYGYISEPNYFNLEKVSIYLHEIAGVLMYMYDAFSGFKRFNAQNFWIKEFHRYEKWANTVEGKYCTLTAKERIDDAIKRMKEFNNALEYYKTHKQTIRKELLTIWQEKRKEK